MRRAISIILLCSACLSTMAQNNEVNSVQPSIMLLPFAKEGQDIRTVIEDDFNVRTAFTKLNESFNQRGFSTLDFRSKLKQLMKMQAMEMENQQTMRQSLIENSTAEIIVEFDMQIENPSAGRKEVVLNLNAYDALSAQTLSSQICRSGPWAGVDASQLTEKAMGKCGDAFLNIMQEKFTDIVENGRGIVVNFTFDQNSEYNMYTEVGADELPLSDALEMWFEENAFKNSYRISGITKTKMLLDDVRIPLKDPVTGNNYSTRKFSLKLYKFLKTELGISCTRDSDMTAVYVTIK